MLVNYRTQFDDPGYKGGGQMMKGHHIESVSALCETVTLGKQTMGLDCGLVQWDK